MHYVRIYWGIPIVPDRRKALHVHIQGKRSHRECRPLSPATVQALVPPFRGGLRPAAGSHQVREGEVVELTAGPDTLDITIEADDPARLPELNKVVEAHIVRYAFRETLEFNWN